MEQSTSKRFEEYPKVDCNECAKYWDNSCDGVKCDVNSDKASTGSTRLCNSFSPTRKVVIPAQMKSLEKRTDKLELGFLFLSIAVIIHLVSHVVGCF